MRLWLEIQDLEDVEKQFSRELHELPGIELKAFIFLSLMLLIRQFAFVVP